MAFFKKRSSLSGNSGNIPMSTKELRPYAMNRNSESSKKAFDKLGCDPTSVKLMRMLGVDERTLYQAVKEENTKPSFSIMDGKQTIGKLTRRLDSSADYSDEDIISPTISAESIREGDTSISDDYSEYSERRYSPHEYEDISELDFSTRDDTSSVNSVDSVTFLNASSPSALPPRTKAIFKKASSAPNSMEIRQEEEEDDDDPTKSRTRERSLSTIQRLNVSKSAANFVKSTMENPEPLKKKLSEKALSLRRISMASPKTLKKEQTEISLKTNSEALNSTTRRGGMSIGDMEYFQDLQNEISKREADIIYGGLVENSSMLTIIAASVDRLVERLTHEKYPDPHFAQVFLLTYRSFLTPSQLLDRLQERWRLTPPNSEDNDGWFAEKKKPIQLRVFNVLKVWVNNYFNYDFTEEKLLNDLKHFIQTDLCSSNETIAQPLLRLVETKEKLLLSKPPKKTNGEGEEEDDDSDDERDLIEWIGREVEESLQEIFGGGNEGGEVLKLNPKEISEQITFREWSLYQKIQPKECLEQRWMGSMKEHYSPNIIRFIEQFNKVGKWVATEILLCSTVEKRVEVLVHFIEVAEYLRRLHNFNGMMEILAGLQSTPIYRLKKTWEALPDSSRNKLKILTDLMSTNDNFSKFRKTLTIIDPPCIPFLGIFLTDLVFIEEGNESKVGELINFRKLTNVAEVILNIQRFQKTPFSLKKNKKLSKYFHSVIIEEEKDCLVRSLELEPRQPRRNLTTSSTSSLNIQQQQQQQQ